MNFASYSDQQVDLAVRLVNHLTSGSMCGKEVPVAANVAAQRLALQQVADAVGVPWRRLDGNEIQQLYQLAAGLRLVFERAEQGDVDGAARQVNRLLEEYRASPELATHDGQGWHLHFHSSDAGAAARSGAACATGLAVVIGTGGADRLGVCNASNCDRVYVDTSRNGCRRFCGESCMNRTKVSKFRARKVADG
jgi:predicted RNA-binding Zn ribbon-like protein